MAVNDPMKNPPPLVRLIHLGSAIRLHRRLGLIAALALLCFAGSGLIHPIMSRTQPQPQSFAPPPLQLPAEAIPLADALAASDIETVRDARLVQAGERAAYRVVTADGATTYLDTTEGRQLDHAEARHAELLARHFSGEQRAAAEVVQVTAFDDDYLSVNRLLPVWRVRFERSDGLTAYVDTEGERLATLVDDRKRLLQGVFRTLHTFSFLTSQPLLRDGVMVALLVISVASALAGLLMFVRLRRADLRLTRMPRRRWHRRLALPVALTLPALAFSGGWHLLHDAQRPVVTTAPDTLFRRDELGTQRVERRFTLARIDGRVCHRIALPPKHLGEHQHHGATAQQETGIAHCLDSRDGAPIANAERTLAEQLARHYARSNAAVAEIEPITQFGGEYGFINKRLPVWRVIFDGDEARWYVETSSGALALRADDSDAREGWSFAYLHKWSFIPSKDLRDLLLMLFALAHVVIALIGLGLLLKRKTSARNL
jgi:hypothetical protein